MAKAIDGPVDSYAVSPPESQPDKIPILDVSITVGQSQMGTSSVPFDMLRGSSFSNFEVSPK